MDVDISKLSVGIFILIMGLLSLIFHKYLGEKVAVFNDRMFHIKYPLKYVKYFQLMYCLIGLIFITFGFFLLIGKLETETVPAVNLGKPHPFTGIIFFIIGSSLIIFHRYLGNRLSFWNNKVLHIEYPIRYCQGALFLIGLTCMVMGVLILRKTL